MGGGQELLVRMISPMVDSEPSNASHTPKSPSTPPALKQSVPIAASPGCKHPRAFASRSISLREPAHTGPTVWERRFGGSGGSRPVRSPSPLRPTPTSKPTPGSASGNKRQWAQTSTEDHVRKELAEQQRWAALAAGKTHKDSHRLWLDKKYKKRTEKRLAKQRANESTL